MNKKIRLNHYLSRSGITSRRKADQLIQSGVIEVNGKTVCELGTIIQTDDIVKLHGEKIQINKNIYLLINKPKGFITTKKDPLKRRTVMHLIPNHLIKWNLFPVGRLDRSTTGVLMLTNDGNVSQKLTHPKYKVQKVYHVFLNKKIHEDDIEKIINGKIRLKEGRVRINFLRKVHKRHELYIGLSIGWNKIIKRIFHKLGYKVIKLDRISFAGLQKKGIKKGGYTLVSKEKIKNILKRYIYHEKNHHY
ncbi:pseudouridine synthase [Blattabacterium cuenoti]|uniref:pseudouridine synthase n=1 Tax=Blattabacterium cuenoti TaxID=1653831 RepID=UPI00163C5B11|nr:pseudouridine synthase [Blattabacterium cuenoti]